MLKLTKTAKIFIIICILDAVLAAGYAGAFQFVKNEDKEAVAKAQELEKEIKRKDSVNALKSEIRASEEERNKLAEYFLVDTEEENVAFIKRLESLGVHAGVDVNIQDISKTNEHTALFNLSTRGGFGENIYFISLVEALPFKIQFVRSYITLEGGNQNISTEEPPAAPVWKGTYTIELSSFLEVENND